MTVQERLYRKVFSVGAYRVVAPKVRAEGLQIATLAQVAGLRLNGDTSFNTYYDTSSAIAYPGNNEDRFKSLPFSQELADVTPETPLYNGGIKLTPEQYTALQAEEFSRNDIITGRRLTQKEAEEHAGWLALLGDKELRAQYVERVFKLVRDKYNEKEAMGFHIRDPQEVPNLRPVCLRSLGSRSLAGDGCGLDDHYARLVGVVGAGAQEKSAEGAHAEISSAKKTLDEKIINAIHAGEQFEFGNLVYTPIPKESLK